MRLRLSGEVVGVFWINGWGGAKLRCQVWSNILHQAANLGKSSLSPTHVDSSLISAQGVMKMDE